MAEPTDSIPSNGHCDSQIFRVGQRINLYGRFPFSQIPEPISRYRGLSPGAKVVYARLLRYGGENGAIFPAMASIASTEGSRTTHSSR